MINITVQTETPSSVLDAMARAILGNDTPGVSVGAASTIHLVDSASATKQNQAQKILDNWDNLSPLASVSSMTYGDSDPTITQTSTDVDVNYIVLFDGVEYASGVATVNAGSASLTLIAPEDGIYDIYFFRTAGNFASGSTQITVNEA